MESAALLTHLVSARLVDGHPTSERVHFTQRALGLGVVLLLIRKVQRRTGVVGGGRFRVSGGRGSYGSTGTRPQRVVRLRCNVGGAGGSAPH